LLPFLEKTFLLACVGVTAEVVFTALIDPNRWPRLRGVTYIWMIPIYGLLYPGFSWLVPRMGDWAWPLRACAYAAIILLGELVTGLILKAVLGEAPWEPGYRGKPRVVAGVMKLDYFPAWALGALAFERAYRILAS
jgi:hypothetical protein